MYSERDHKLSMVAKEIYQTSEGEVVAKFMGQILEKKDLNVRPTEISIELSFTFLLNTKLYNPLAKFKEDGK